MFQSSLAKTVASNVLKDYKISTESVETEQDKYIPKKFPSMIQCVRKGMTAQIGIKLDQAGIMTTEGDGQSSRERSNRGSNKAANNHNPDYQPRKTLGSGILSHLDFDAATATSFTKSKTVARIRQGKKGYSKKIAEEEDAEKDYFTDMSVAHFLKELMSDSNLDRITFSLFDRMLKDEDTVHELAG